MNDIFLIMKKVLIFCLVYLFFGTISAQKFPVSYKIKRSYQECSECHVKTRSNWTLVNQSNYSETLRESIEYKIFEEKTYPERTSWYFSEKDYDQPCSVTMNGRHVWEDQLTTISDNISKDYFVQYEKRQAEKKDQEQKKVIERQSEEQLKELRKNLIVQKENQINELRFASNTLKESGDFKGALKTQLNIIKIWTEIDSLYDLNYGTRNLFFFPNSKVEYKSDVYNYTLDLIYDKQYNLVFKITEFYLWQAYNTRSRFRFDVENQQSFDFKINVNYFLSFLLSDNYLVNKQKFYDQLRVGGCFSIDGTNSSQEFNKQLLNQLELLRDKGWIIPDFQFLILVLKCKLKETKFVVAKNSSKSMCYWFDQSKYLMDDFLSSFHYKWSHVGDVWSFGEDRTKNIIKIEDNLFYFDDKDYGEYGARIIFCLDNQSNLHFLYKCKMYPSDKKLAKIIAESKEIRDKDLGNSSN